MVNNLFKNTHSTVDIRQVTKGNNWKVENTKYQKHIQNSLEMILFAPKLILTNVYALPSVQPTGDQCCT